MRTSSKKWRGAVVALGIAAWVAACSRVRPGAPPSGVASGGESSASATGAPAIAAPPDHAEIGRPAPDFSLPDLDGHVVHLTELRGKPVVLEWFNPGCPFVNASHTK